VFAYGVGLPTSGAATSLGLATEFIFLPIPRLTIMQQSSNVLLRWNYRPDGFVLQQSAVLGSGANWQPTGGLVTTNGFYKEITLPLHLEVPTRFFRLVLPASSAGSAEIQTGGERILIPNQTR